jgi:hypothetical protein
MKTIRFGACILVAIVLGDFLVSRGAEAQSDNSAINFGTHDIGTKTVPVAIPLKNPTNSKVKFTVTPSKDSKPDYQIERNACADDVAPNATCVVEISFAPISEGIRAGEFLVAYQAGSDGKPSSLPSVKLTGTGSFPELGISSTQIYFSVQSVSTASSPQTITLTNNSANELTINKIMVSGDFLLEAPVSDLKLKSKESTMAVVIFKPMQEGTASGTVTIFSTAKNNPLVVYLSGGTSSPWNELCTTPPAIEISLVLVLCLLYWMAMVIVRWNRVARPTRELLKAEIRSTQAELDIVSDGKPGIRAGRATDLLTGATNLIDNVDQQWWKKMANFLFWSRGQEITGWKYVHKAASQLTPYLADQTVIARLETNEQKLRAANDGPSTVLADAIRRELTAASPDIERRKALLTEALDKNYGREDTSFSELVSWQNKTSWLVGCGLVLIVVLTGATSHHSILFLVGATGGLLSRLSRSLDRKDVPSDYGASWTTLFLSPIAGALGAWAGILLSGLAAQLNVLGTMFKVEWSAAPCQSTTLAIALVFGFSERLLDSVFDKLVENTGAAQATTKNPQPPQMPDGGPSTISPVTPSLAIPEQGLANGTVGVAYSAQLRAEPTANVTWSLQTGSLPGGLALGAEGKITGTPISPGKFTFDVVASLGTAKQNRTFTITIS